MKLWGKKQVLSGGSVVMSNYGARSNYKLNDYIREGYKANAIVNRCIKEIVQAITSVEIEIHKGETVLESHYLYDLIKKPNPTESGAQFIRRVFTDYLIGGNAYISDITITGGKVTELWIIDPRYTKPMAGPTGIPSEYKYDDGQNKKVFPVDPKTGLSQIFHYKNYDPENPLIGMSPLQPAAMSADAHNAGLLWNYSLLKNGARPSGIIKFKTTPGAEVIARLTEFFKKRFQGAANAGDIPMLTNDAEFQAIDQSARDMDFLNAMKEYTKYIASVIGVPLALVDNDASSFNNLEQSKERLWTDTIIPLFDDFLDSFGNWLFARAGETGLKFSINIDSIPALEGLRKKRYERMGKAVKDSIITPNEAREALDYTPIPGAGDSILVSSSMVPIDMIENPSEEPDNDPMPDKEDAEKHMRWLQKTVNGLSVPDTVQ